MENHQVTLLERRLQEKVDSVNRRGTSPGETFIIDDALMFMSLAAQSLSQDEFSKCFEPKPIVQEHLYGIWYFVWLVGVIIRYGVLFPLRLFILTFGLFLFLVSLCIARVLGRVDVERWLFTITAKIWLFSYGAIIRHHGKKPRVTSPHIFVANHTSFTDFIVLTSHEFPHGVVAQHHGGLFGVFMKYVLELYGSVSFNRNEQRDRHKVAEKIRTRISNPNQFAPLLIFPEGTCVNNESTVLFHKGVFELDCAICPVGIKYNKKLLDPYWNTREQTFTQHILYLMTRWMMMVDVWWLPPQKILEGETAIQFADRVKGMISHAAGLKNRSWNGYLKNVMRAMDRERMQKSSQSKYAGYLKVLNVSSESLGMDRSNSPCSVTESTMSIPSSSESEGLSKPVSIRRRPYEESDLPHSRSYSGPTMRRKSANTVSPISSLHTPPEFPQWLNEAAIIDAKNNLLLKGTAGLSTTSAHLSSLKASLYYSLRGGDQNSSNDSIKEEEK